MQTIFTTVEGAFILKNITLFLINTLLALFALYCFIEWIRFSFGAIENIFDALRKNFNRRKK